MPPRPDSPRPRPRAQDENRSAPRLRPKRPDPAPIPPAPPTVRAWWVAIPLVLLVVAAFAPVLENGFVDLDDEEQFVKNPHYRGVGPAQIAWACRSMLLGAYQPLTRVMQGLEYTIWGMDPHGYHLASLTLHAAVAVVLFALTCALLRRAMPGAGAGPVAAGSGLAVALFAAHPLRAEVVAWATAQGYLPCTLFGMLTVLAYLRAQPPDGRTRPGWLVVSYALFPLALAGYSVPMGLPLVLLVLDVYPLRRWGGDRGWSARGAFRIGLEKVPFLAASAWFGSMAVAARSTQGSVPGLADFGVMPRVAQACYSAAFYLARTALPAGLSSCYPAPPRPDWTEPRFALSILVVAALSATAFGLRRRLPALAAAWACYLVILLPNSGLVRNTELLAADRYSYLATMALVAPAAAGLVGLGRRLREAAPPARIAAAGVAAAAVVILAGMSREQCRVWHDSVALWGNADRQLGRPDAYLLTMLGRAQLNAGRGEEAVATLVEAVRAAPHFPLAHDKLGLALLGQGRLDEAAPHFAEAVRLEPRYVEGRMNLGFIHAQRGRPREAEAQFAEVLRLNPDFPEGRRNLGALLSEQHRDAEAEAQFAEAARLEPENPVTRMDLGYALFAQGKAAEAADQFAEAARLRPDDPDARNNLGAALTRQGRLAEARDQYLLALRLNPGHDGARRGLAELARAPGAAPGRRF